MGRVVHFEIHAEDPGRARVFYEKVFDWEFRSWPGPEEYWLVRTGPSDEPGIDGGMIRRRGLVEGTAILAYVCTVQVDDVDAAIQRIVDAGGSVVVPSMPIPGVGWLAYAKDTEGNILGVMREDRSAR